ncbi:cortical protein marker for cell polarity-domain-containing protein [Limtongia smithiae]|uniref:cortical protein marker for cell polarity-domain-containing protein n=1 Tax=Limtongia smithiae TaxID=1125753 RepID=UPI0034CD3D95
MRLRSLAWLAPAAILTVDAAISVQSVSLPDIDFASLGEILFTGNFKGISVNQYSDNHLDIDNASSTDDYLIYSPRPNSYLELDASDGDIRSICELDGIAYLAGNFTRLGSQEIRSVAAVNTTSGDISALDSGISGEALVAYCDTDNRLVYFGGSFDNNVAIWNISSSSWADVPFTGLTGGPVTSIVSWQDNLVFGGKFTGLGNGTSSTSDITYTTSELQLVNLKVSNVTVSGTSNSSYSDPRSVICASNISASDSTWLLEDGQKGMWHASFSYYAYPTRIRLRNADADGRGTKTFRFIAEPINGILNLTYTDPDTGATAYCDAFCPLANISTADYQDFEFVNVIGMEGFYIDILDYYGAAGGLSEVQLYQEKILTYAINDYNEPLECGIAADYISKATSTGDWDVTTVSGTSYLSSNVSESSSDDISVTLYPAITLSGNYSVLLYTPGCTGDNTCSYRGRVNITVVASPDEAPTSSTLYQTNDYEKFDIIYEGYVEANDDSFRPSVTVAPLAGQSGNFTVVAESVQFIVTSTSGGLNGLFEYEAANYTSSNASSIVIYDTAVNSAGNMLDDSAYVYSLAATDSALFVAGKFSGDSVNNFFALSSGGDLGTAHGGLDDAVYTIALTQDENSVLVGGNFTASADDSELLYVASYSIENGSWTALDAGLNGPVDTVVKISLNISGSVYSVLAFNGNFTEINGYEEDDAIKSKGFALWIESDEEWAERSSLELPYLTGSLSSSADLGDGASLLVGNIIAESLSTSSGAIMTSDLDLSGLPFSFEESDESSSLKKRAVVDIFSDVAARGIFAGSFMTLNDTLFTAVSGKFTVDSADQFYENFVVFDSDKVIGGLSEGELSEDSAITVVYNHQNTSFIIGGAFSGTIGSSTVNGLAIWNAITGSFASTQPSALGGNNVQVNAITLRPNSSELVIAGSFSTAGNISCSNLCLYDTETGSWSAVADGLSGNITSFEFLDANKLVVVGNMTTSDYVKCYMAQYDFSTSSWNMLGTESNQLQGPVEAFVISDSIYDVIVAGTYLNNTDYLWAYASDSWTDIGADLSNGSKIYDILLLNLKTADDSRTSSIIPSDRILLVVGDLIIDSDHVSAALYDGSSWTPFLYTVKDDGTAGSVFTISTEIAKSIIVSAVTEEEVHHMKSGYVVLISLAISVAIMCLLVGGAFLIGYWKRRSEGYEQFPVQYDNRIAQLMPPSALFTDLSASPRS